MRARIGFSYGGINEAGMNSTQVGMMIDADMTHIGGTYWNFAGYLARIIEYQTVPACQERARKR